MSMLVHDEAVRLLCDAGLWASRSAAARDTIARSASWSGTADVTRHAYGLFAGDCVRLAEDINDHTLTEIG